MTLIGYTLIPALLTAWLNVISLQDNEPFVPCETSGLAFPALNCDVMVNAGPDITVCPDEPKSLQGFISGNYTSFRWEPTTGLDDPFSLTPNVSTNVPRTYTLISEGTSGNLIVNGGFEAGGIAPSTTGYNYVDPNSFVFAGDRSYTIGNNGTFGNIWGCNPQEGSWAMAINGATTPNVDVWCQTVNVTPGADHMFQAWVMGITIPFQNAYADLQFLINGVPLGNLQAPVATCAWAPFMANWNSGASSSATICIRNLNTSGTGNYCAIDDISLVEKCVRQDEVEVFIDQLTAVVQNPPLVTCTQNPVPLDATGTTTGPGYQYRWDTNDGEILGPRNGLQIQISKPGTYSFTVTSPAGCTETIEVFVDGNTTPPDIMASGDTLSCDKPEGKLFANSFTPNVRYLWKGPNNFRSTEKEPTVRDTGSYTIVVSDDYGCRDSVTVQVPSSGFLPSLDIAGDTLRCGTDSVELRATTNGIGPRFEWTGPGNFASDTAVISVRDTGWYVLTLTDSTGCQALDSFYVIDQTGAVPARLEGDTISCARSEVNISVQSDSVIVQFDWTGPGGFRSSEESPAVSDSGWYVLDFLTPAGCPGRDSIFIPLADDLPSLSITGDTIRCDQPLIPVIASSNAPDYTVTWTGPAGFMGTGGQTTVNDTGWYVAFLETPGGCRVTDSIFIYGDLIRPSSAYLNDTLNCLDTAGRFIQLVDPGQVLYSWSGPAGFRSSEAEPEVKDTGSYTLILTASNGCNDTISATLFASLDLPDIQVQTDTLNCIRSTGTISGSSTTQGISYEWSGPNGFNSTDPVIQVGDTGVYVLEVTAPNGCRNRSIVILEGDFDGPELLSSPDPDTLNCRNRQIDLSIDLAPGNYQFSWSGPGGFSSYLPNPSTTEGGRYTAVITGLNGCRTIVDLDVVEDLDIPDLTARGDTITCDRSAGQLFSNSMTPGVEYQWSGPRGFVSDQPTPAVFDTGQYTLIITAPNGCTNTQTVEVTLDAALPQVSPLLPDTLNCIQTFIDLTAMASGTGLMYRWTRNGTTLGTGPNIRLDEAGDYYLDVTNDAGCTTQVPFTVVLDTMAPVADLLAGRITCADPTTEITNSMHEEGLIYAWSGPGGFSSDQIQPSVTRGGNYSLTLTDPSNGCSSSTSIDIEENLQAPVDMEILVEEANCDRPNGAIAVLDIEGGTGPFEYSLDGGQSFTSSSEFRNIPPGNYELIVRDANGCTLSRSIEIQEQPGVMIVAPVVIRLNQGASAVLDVQTNLSASEIRSIVWSPADGLSCIDCLNPTVIGITNRNYSLTITDIFGCSASAVIRIEVESREDVFVPTAFTPNDDGNNDSFIPSVRSTPDRLEMSIFNRWGVMVYLYDGPFGPEAGWDGSIGGKIADPAVFVYRITLHYGNKPVVLTGDITLLR